MEFFVDTFFDVIMWILWGVSYVFFDGENPNSEPSIKAGFYSK